MASPAEIAPPVASIPEAIERMDAIAGDLPKRDGVACFNRLYVAVTRSVQTWLTEDRFEDPDFLDRLDVAFANRYFDALRAWGTGRPRDAPRVWRALFKVRDVRAITSVQFAAAGINAHINLDLAAALLRTCAELGVKLGTGTQKADYLKVNDIFATLYRAARQDFVESELEVLDRGQVAVALDAISHFTVEAARDTAWRNAHLVLDLQDVPFIGDDLVARFNETVDRSFGYAAQGLLVRVVDGRPPILP